MDEALIILTQPPFGHVHAVECLRMASGLKAMDINAKLVLIGEATFTLLKNQDGSGIHMPPMNAALDVLAMSEAPIAAIQEDMDILGITRDDLIDYPYLEIIDREECEARIAASKCAFRF
jgi:sulfur relay (sulfurtransferase) DsrF/TusC family protein